MFGARACDANGVRFLECVGADHECWNLARQNDDWNAVEQGVSQARNCVGRAGARRYKANAGLACGTGVPFGCVYSTLFMTYQNVLDVVLLENCIVDWEDGTTRVSKDCVHTLIYQGLNYHFRSGHLACHLLGSVFKSIIYMAQKKAPVLARAHGYLNGVPLPDHALCS